jgi:saccharopine dehydrogenase-like NADP-dependent oxidoreductase
MQLKKHLVTASYVDESMSMLDEKAKSVGITILGEMGLDPRIGNSNSCTQGSVIKDCIDIAH